MEQYKLLAKIFMYTGPVLVILSVLCGLGYKHYSNKVKELMEAEPKVEERLIPSSKGASINFNVNELVFSRIQSEGHAYDKQFGIVLYNIALVNLSQANLTIKEVLFECDFKGEHYSVKPLNINTGIVRNKENTIVRNAIHFETSETEGLYLMDWENIIGQIENGPLLQPGEVLKGSAYFVLPFKDPSDFSIIKNLSFTVVDYLGNSNSSPINFEHDSDIPVWPLTHEKFDHISE